MTLLSIAQDTADVIGLTRPAAIVSASTDQVARQILGFAKKTLEELSSMDWPKLQASFGFSTANGTSQYALPADFSREMGDTLYSTARFQQLRGSLTPGDWARQRNALPSVGQFRFRIFGSPLMLNISPTPTTVEAYTFEYVTSNRVVSALGVPKATFTADDDVSVVDEDLMKKGLEWRMRRAKGLDYSEEFDDYETTRAQRLAQALQFGSMPVAYRGAYDGAELAIGYVPDHGFG